MNSHTTMGRTEGLGGVYSQVLRSYYHFKRVRSGQQGAESEQMAGRVGLLGMRFGGTLGWGGNLWCQVLSGVLPSLSTGHVYRASPETCSGVALNRAPEQADNPSSHLRPRPGFKGQS